MQKTDTDPALHEKSLLVHLHLYYGEMWPELHACMRNITVPFDLHVTMPAGNTSVQRDVQEAFPQACFHFVPNKGYDVGPFMEVLNNVDLDKYAYVIKLHSKRNLPSQSRMDGMRVGGSKWRDALLDFVRTPQAFASALAYMEQHPAVGAVGHWELIVRKRSEENVRRAPEIDRVIQEQGWKCCDYSFIAGTMFLMRAALLKPLQNRWRLEDFEAPSADSTQLAHVVERILGYLVYMEGCVIRDWRLRPWGHVRRFFEEVLRFLYCGKMTRSGRYLVKVCKIPVWWGKRKSA